MHLVNSDALEMMEDTLLSTYPMLNVLSAFLAALFSVFRTQAVLQVEILALRHQIGVLQRPAGERPRLTTAARCLLAWRSGCARDKRAELSKPSGDSEPLISRAGSALTYR